MCSIVAWVENEQLGDILNCIPCVARRRVVGKSLEVAYVGA